MTQNIILFRDPENVAQQLEPHIYEHYHLRACIILEANKQINMPKNEPK